MGAGPRSRLPRGPVPPLPRGASRPPPPLPVSPVGQDSAAPPDATQTSVPQGTLTSEAISTSPLGGQDARRTPPQRSRRHPCPGTLHPHPSPAGGARGPEPPWGRPPLPRPPQAPGGATPSVLGLPHAEGQPGRPEQARPGQGPSRQLPSGPPPAALGFWAEESWLIWAPISGRLSCHGLLKNNPALGTGHGRPLSRRLTGVGAAGSALGTAG